MLSAVRAVRTVLTVCVTMILCAGVSGAKYSHAQASSSQSNPSQSNPSRSGPIVSTEDPALWYFNSLLSRGYLSDLDQGVFPIRERDLIEALEHSSAPQSSSESEWIRLVRTRLHDFTNSKSAIGIRVRPGVMVASQERSELLRTELNPNEAIFSQVAFESWFTAGNWTAAWGWRHDRYYDMDPDGFDTAHRWFIRPENAYLSYDGTYASVLFGRTTQHWGTYGQPGLLLSQNPRPMDHISFRLGTSRLNLRTSLSELDSITGDGRFTGVAGDDSVSTGSERRYLAVHRLSFARPGKWTVGLMHSILYSGPNSNFSLKFANPFHLALLSIDERPKNEENNGLLGVFVQLQRPSTVFSAQLTLDDFDLLNGNEPASISASAQIYQAQLAADIDASLGVTVVTARTYNADQPEGKYIYLGRGIATQFSDYVHVWTSVHWMRFSGLRVSPRIDVLFQGEQDIRMPFPRHDAADLILDGVVERTIRPSLQLAGLLSNNIDVRLNAGWNISTNSQHIENSSGSDFVGSASISYRINWSRDL